MVLLIRAVVVYAIKYCTEDDGEEALKLYENDGINVSGLVYICENVNTLSCVPSITLN